MIHEIRQALRLGALALAAAAFVSKPAIAEPVTIEWWHAMGSELGERVNELADGFNSSQDKYAIKPVFKGTYDENYNATIAAYRAKRGPVITQIPERGFMSMLLSKAIIPVNELMEKNGHKVDWSDFIKPVFGFYSHKGKLMTMPFNSSSPILWYNKDHFQKAGFEKPADTWQELEKQFYVIKEKGISACGTALAADYYWSLLENYSAINDIPYATKGNGFDGLDTEFTYNKTSVVQQVTRLKRWLDDGILKIAGQGANPQQLLTSGTCSTFAASTAAHASIERTSEIPWSATTLPHEEGVTPKNATIGGATLWVMKGHKEQEYAAAAAFFAHIAKPDVQVWWHKATGYVPITNAAYKVAKAEGYYDKYPTRELAILQLNRGEPSENSRGFHFGNFFQATVAQREEIEAIFVGKKSVQEALDDSVRRGNEMLRQFEKLHAGDY